MKLSKLAVAATSLIGLATPSVANDNTLRVSVTVPLRCEVSVLNTSIDESAVTLDLARSCNSRHQVIVTSKFGDGSVPITVQSRDGQSARFDGVVRFAHREQFTSQFERYVFNLPNASPDVVRAFANNLAVNIEAS